MPIQIWSAVFILLLAIQIFLGVEFDGSSDGFAANVEGTVFYCRTLLSSGSDDDVITMVLILQLLPAGIRLFRLSKNVKLWEVYVFCGTSVVAVAIIQFGIECGNLIYTTFVVGDISLLAILFIFPTALLALLIAKAKFS